MAQCAANTKDGASCKIPTQEGQKYCHIHRRQRILRRIATGAVVLAMLSFVADVTGVLNYFGVNLPFSKSQPSESLNPYRQPIRAATATVEIAILSDESINTTYLDSGGYIAFGKGNEPLLIMRSMQSTAQQTGEGEVVYRAVLSMDVEDGAVGKPIDFLKEAEYVQVGFYPMPKESKIVTGKVICVFNSLVLIEIPVSPQETVDGRFFVRNFNFYEAIK